MQLKEQSYNEMVARETERLLNLKVPLRSYDKPFPAYGKRPNGTFGPIGMHGCHPGEYWTLEEWEEMHRKNKDS
jgi:hypothetical protein